MTLIAESELTVKEWAKVRRELLVSGTFDVNLETKMSSYQLRALKDFNNTLRELKKLYDTNTTEE